jgi:hypothetical protein
MRSTSLALPVQVTLPGRCQPSPAKVGSGIQALSAKVGSRRVVSSKVRQPLGVGVNSMSAAASGSSQTFSHGSRAREDGHSVVGIDRTIPDQAAPHAAAACTG